MGVSLFAVMFFMLFLYRRIVMAGSYVTITGKAFRPRVADVGPLRYVLLGVCLLYLLAAVGLPLVTLLYASLQKIAVAFPAAGNWTLENFRVAMTMNAVRSALTNSLLLGFGTATIGVVLMGLLAWLIYRSRLPGSGLIEYVVMFPQAVPRLVFAFGLMWAWVVFRFRSTERCGCCCSPTSRCFCRSVCAPSPASCCRSTRVSRNARRCAARPGRSGCGR